MISRELMLAVLAMDTYHRGYLPGLKMPGTRTGEAAPAIIGSASIDTARDQPEAQDISFFAQSYTLNGETIIGYRGTDDDISTWAAIAGGAISSNHDVYTGYGLALGRFRGPQALMAIDFYQEIVGRDQSMNWQTAGQATLVGQSLGGGLAGFVASLYGQNTRLFSGLAGCLRPEFEAPNPTSRNRNHGTRSSSTRPWSGNLSGPRARTNCRSAWSHATRRTRSDLTVSKLADRP